MVCYSLAFLLLPFLVFRMNDLFSLCDRHMKQPHIAKFFRLWSFDYEITIDWLKLRTHHKFLNSTNQLHVQIYENYERIFFEILEYLWFSNLFIEIQLSQCLVLSYGHYYYKHSYIEQSTLSSDNIFIFYVYISVGKIKRNVNLEHLRNF